ncbi:MAG: glycosyltransferase family 4 protein, partial [Acidobacteria bacterium]|nr:glycosyltransferase family 4 protein [Acidobacteriota bacterium]
MTRLRILILTTYFHPVIGGVETHARQLAVWLRTHDVSVQVLTKRIDDATPTEDTVDGVPVRRIGPAGPRTGIAKWLMAPFVVADLLRRRSSFDVIYCPDPRGVGLAVLGIHRLLRRPVVMQLNTPGALSCANWDPLLQRLWIAPDGRLASAAKIRVRRTFARAAACVCISRDIETEARACGFDGERIIYLPHGVDLTRFRPAAPDEVSALRAALGLPAGRVVCLFLGRLSVEKGVLDLLEAWRMLRDQTSLLVLAGPEMPGHHLDAGGDARRFVAAHGLHDRVWFLGPVRDPDRFLRAADVCVAPSHYEAFSLSIVEAMATGLAVVATHVGGIRHYLHDGDNALVCPPHDKVSLARQL